MSNDTIIDSDDSESPQIDEDCEPHRNQSNLEKLICPKCDKEFNKKSTFLEHLQSYLGALKTCLECKQVFKNSTAFQYHKQLILCKQSNKIFKCTFCCKTLYGSSQYSTHLSAHKRNQCRICGSHFSKKKHLQTHNYNVHHTSLNKDNFRCHLCEKIFVQKRSLIHHYMVTHEGSSNVSSTEDTSSHESKKVFTCSKCNAQLATKQAYLMHLNDHGKYRCLDCKVGFTAKKAAEMHQRKGHVVEGLSQVQCAECGLLFSSQSSLRNHTVIQHSDQTYPCEKCKITFKHKRHLEDHLETNEHIQDEEPKILLACKECNKTFVNKKNLRAHNNRMHNASLQEHSCSLCSYKTTAPFNLKRHMTLHMERPQLICDKCAAKFQTKSALQEHYAAIHSDRKEFSCDKCGNQFNRRSDLNRHLLNTHSDTAQYSCHCGNSYRTLSSLKRHQLITHKSVSVKQKRLEKLYPVEVVKRHKTKSKKLITNKKHTNSVEESQLTSTENCISETDKTNSAAIMAKNSNELLQLSYNIAYPTQTIEDKSQVVYSQELDMSSFQVVESMIQLDRDLEGPGTNVLINVRNIFGKTDPNNYIIDNSVEHSLVNNLERSLSDISAHQKHQDLIANLQDYIIPNDLNFLNV